MNAAMHEQIKQYIQSRADARLEKLDKEATKQGDASDSVAAKRQDELAQFQPRTWLSDAALRAKQLNFATHPVKFTHSDAKGASSVYALGSDTQDEQGTFLSTSSLKSALIDVAGNAAALDVAQLLQLEVAGVSLASLIKQGDMSALQPFAEDEAQLAQWQQGFSAVFADKEIRSHSLAKQVYFPLEDGSYHLLSPLFSSSLAQALYQRINDSRYSDAAIENRKLRRENKPSELPTVDFRNIAVQKFGGTKPQNISQANSRRGGKAYLLSCQPPVWQSRLLPSLHQKNAFWAAYERRDDYHAKNTVRRLKLFLTKHLEDDSNKRLRDQTIALVDELIDTMLQYAAEIQSMTEHIGWSAQAKIIREEQLWLDPYRKDESFREERARNEWQEKIAEQFAGWLNHKLKSDKLNMKSSEFTVWKNMVEQRLARLKEDLIYDSEEWDA